LEPKYGISIRIYQASGTEAAKLCTSISQASPVGEFCRGFLPAEELMNPRNRLINFRVTDEEFQRLKTATALQNARCLSDFARSAILETVRTGDSVSGCGGSMAGQLLALDRRLSKLESHLSRLYDALAATVAAPR
jgi:hypothetical protein